VRLTITEIKILKQSIQSLDNTAEVFLFGSRVDDNQRGGDIDILIQSQHLSRRDLRHIRGEFCQQFGEQKLDLVIDNGADNQAFIKMIQLEAVLL